MAAAAPTINIKLTEFSLPVPSVQELTIQQPGTVPNQYIRDDISDIVTVPSSLRAPLIDMAKLVNPDSRLEQLQKLHSACKEWGVFQLINHGVPDEVIRNIREQAQEFFDLPLQEKQNWAQKPGSLEGYGQAFVLEKEQKLQWKCSSSKLFPSKPESWISGLKNLKASEKHWELMLKKRGKLWFLYRGSSVWGFN